MNIQTTTPSPLYKAPASNQCHAALAGLTVSSTLIGTIGLIAGTILWMSAPLLIPVIAFQATLVGAGALLLLGTLMTIALTTIARGRPEDRNKINSLQHKLLDSREVRKNLLAENKELKSKLHLLRRAPEKNLELREEINQLKKSEEDLTIEFNDLAKNYNSLLDEHNSLKDNLNQIIESPQKKNYPSTPFKKSIFANTNTNNRRMTELL